MGTVENRLFMAAVASLLPQPNLIRGWWLFCPLPCPRGWRWGLALSRQHCVARCPWQAGPRALQLIWWTQLTLSNSCHLKSFALVRSFHPIFELSISNVDSALLCILEIQGCGWVLLTTKADPGTCHFVIFTWIPLLYQLGGLTGWEAWFG